MKLFGQVVRTLVNVAAIPVAIVADAVTLGGISTDRESYTLEQLERLKREAAEDED